MTRSGRLAAAFAACILCVAPGARAQQAEDQAAAQALFDEGRQLMKAGRFESACPKFEAAAKLSGSAGAYLNLGDCHERLGLTASAWAEFGEAATAADHTNRHDQATEARRRMAILKPKLSRLTIVVPRQVAGLIVMRDATEVTPAAWGTAIPVDSGSYRIRARAAGHESWEISVEVSATGQTVSVEVPELPPSPVAAPTIPTQGTASPASPAPPASPARPAADLVVETGPPRSRSSALGIGLLAGGALVGLGGGALMEVEALRASSARAHDGPGGKYAASKNEYDATYAPYVAGIAAACLGGAAAAVGLVVVVTAHHGSRTTTVGASPWVTPGGAGVALRAPW